MQRAATAPGKGVRAKGALGGVLLACVDRLLVATQSCELVLYASAHSGGDPLNDFGLRELQDLMKRMYLPRDVERGVAGTFMWLIEEIGELATALRSGDRQNAGEEFADVLAWLATIANVMNIDLAEAVRTKYGDGCPGCGTIPCTCSEQEKP